MEYAAIRHNGDNKYCYALEKDQFLFRIQVKKDDVKRVTLHHQDKYLPLLTPGMPMIYYGDEFGMQGGADPDCRREMSQYKGKNELTKETIITGCLEPYETVVLEC